MRDKYEETFQSWNNIAELYEDKFMNLPLYNETYDFFSEMLKEGSSLLEIGCGPGNISKYIVAREKTFNLLGIDISENMIKLAKGNVPSAEFKVLDCRKVLSITQTFDAIIVGFTIPYLSSSETLKLMRDCKELLNPEGVLYLSFVEGKNHQSGYITGSSGDRMYFFYHQV